MIPEISPADAHELIDADICFVDIRDPMSFADARIKGARALSMQTMDVFLQDVPRQKRLIVYCYHGHSSLDATGFLQDQGFEQVESLQGGFEYWRQAFPEAVESGQ